MKKITLIITARNEGEEPLKTVKSIRETSNDELVDIILFNDGAEKWEEIPKEYNVKVIHKTNAGAPANYDEGVRLAKTQYVAILNSRMVFKDGWLNKVLKYLNESSKTIFCTTSVVLDQERKEKGKRYGAKINFIDKDNILNPEWLKAKKEKCYEVPCLLGANYFTTKKWYQYIGGFEGLFSYGGMCAFLSLKCWVMGGKIKLIKDVEIGNIYREIKEDAPQKPYSTNMANVWYNKILTGFLLFDNKKAIELLDTLIDNPYYTMVMRELIKNFDSIQKMKSKIKSKTINNVLNYI